MSVPRYIATRVRPGSTVNAAFERVVVLFADHEAALAAARAEAEVYRIELEGIRTHLGRIAFTQQLVAEGEQSGWDAALDAVQSAVDVLRSENPVNGTVYRRNVREAIAALRKTPPQPEPLTREEQNERWRQDYNTQARLRKVGDWRLTEYPKPFDDAAAAQPEGGESHG